MVKSSVSTTSVSTVALGFRESWDFLAKYTKKERSSPGLRTWSPTVLLAWPEHA